MRRAAGQAATLLLAVLAVALPGRAEAKRARRPARPATLEDRLVALARRPPLRRRSEFAVVVAPLGGTALTVAVNPDRPLVLASVTKLFTTAAALDRLGPDYSFRTRLYREGDVSPDGMLAGPLVVVGGGDPALSGRFYGDDPLAVFRPWADSLVRQGIRTIRDGLLLDVSFFDEVRVHPDWPSDQEQRWWQAPVSALSYNDNVVLVRASGGVRPGAPAILGFQPAGPLSLSLVSRVVTSTWRTWMGIRRQAGSSRVVAAGRVGRNRTWTGDITVPDPPLYFASAFSRVLEDVGITVESATAELTEAPRSEEGAPARALLHTHETPLLPVLAVCNKRSQSFFAEQILKTLGAERRGRGSWENGLAEVRDFLASLGLDPSRYHLVDGSGRSPNNRASAADYVAFLQALATKWDRFDLFKPTLAISGDPDGTLRHRMVSDATRGRVFAKTGNIAGVVTLCGYLTAQSGQTYAFSILMGGGISEGRGHAWQDRFLTALAQNG